MNSTDTAATDAAPRAGARSELAAGIIRLTAGRGLSVALNFVAWAVMARALGPTSFGILQFAISVVFYLSFATDLGLTTYGTREFAGGGRQERVVRSVMGMRLALAVIVTAVAIGGALLIPWTGEQRNVSLAVSSVIAAGALNVLWLLRAQGRSTAMALQDVAAATVLAGGAVVIVLPSSSPVLAAAVYAGAQWLAALMSLRTVGGLGVLRPSFVGAAVALRASLPLGVAVLAVNIYYTADSVLLGVLRTTTEVGLYGAAYRLVLPWLMLASVAGLLAMPTLTRLLQREGDEAVNTVQALSKSLLVIGLPVAAATTVVAAPLVSLVFGTGYERAALPLQILIWSCVTVFANAPFGFMILARRKDRAYMWIAVAGALTNLGLNAILIPTAGMVGAAVATIAAELTVLVAMIWATRETSIRILISTLPPALILAAATAAAMWPLRDSVLALAAGAAAFVIIGSVIGALPLRSLVGLARGAVGFRGGPMR